MFSNSVIRQIARLFARHAKRLLLIRCLVLISSNFLSQAIAHGVPPESAGLFMPSIFPVSESQWTPVFTPDGNEIYYVVKRDEDKSKYQILFRKKQNGQWSAPRPVSFSSEYTDSDPSISPDGKRLVFCSNRPIKQDALPQDNFDLWYVDRVDDNWGKAIRIDEISDDDHWEIYPSQSKNGNLYFSADYDGGYGDTDIYLSVYKGGKYQKPVNLGPVINTPNLETEAYISPNEDMLIFTAERENDSYGSTDLYVTRKNTNQQWAEPVNLGISVNSDAIEQAPVISINQKFLVFSSKRISIGKKNGYTDQLLNGSSNVYWVKLPDLTFVRNNHEHPL